MHKVTQLIIKENFIIHLFFEDGFNAEVDFREFLEKGIALELLDKQAFSDVYIESGGGIAWRNGFDFCPNYLYEQASDKILKNARDHPLLGYHHQDVFFRSQSSSLSRRIVRHGVRSKY